MWSRGDGILYHLLFLLIYGSFAIFYIIINLPILTIMSNACKNSLLIIATVAICVATPLLASKVLAQSELYFPASSKVSFVAPGIDVVFDGQIHETAFVVKAEQSEVIVKNTVIVRDAKPAIAVEKVISHETPVTDFTVVKVKNDAFDQSELYFPVQKNISYSAPSMNEVFFTNQEYSTAIIDPITYEDMTKAEMQALIAKEIINLERQLVALQQRVAALKEVSVDEFGCGACGSHVKNLQKFLNRNGFALAATGPGSAGQETKFFGPLTLRALQKFQSTYGIPVSGSVDTSTRTLIDSIAYNALGEMTVESCVKQRVIQKNKAPKREEKSENPQDDGKSESGNFFITLIKKIFGFFRNLFQRS